MSDEKKSREPWLTGNLFPRLGLILCQVWIIVAVGALVMVFVVWSMILVQNLEIFDKVMDAYIGNNKMRYDQCDMNPGSGYVAGTNIPKQLGGAVFATLFCFAMFIFIFLAAAADTAWRFPRLAVVFQMFHTDGLVDDRKLDEARFWFIWVGPFRQIRPVADIEANGFLKIFIVVATGSTSFYGLRPDNPDIDTPLFCLYATFILLCSVPLTMLSNIVSAAFTVTMQCVSYPRMRTHNQMCVHARRQAEWPKIFAERKADIESAAKAEGVKEYEEARKKKKEEEAKAAKDSKKAKSKA